MDNVHTTRPKRTLVLVAVQKGRTRITHLLAPTLRVVRDQEPPRIEFVTPSTPEAA